MILFVSFSFMFLIILFFFFFNDTATTEIYTLSLHDALPISPFSLCRPPRPFWRIEFFWKWTAPVGTICSWTRKRDRKSTRLNSSHLGISYAVFCLKKKKQIILITNLISHAICKRLIISKHYR